MDSEKTSIFSEAGVTGLNSYGGRIYEEPNWRLSAYAWRRAIRDMTANDPVVNAVLNTIDMLMRQATWKIVPFSDDKTDVENGDFIRDCLFKDMSQTWQETVSEINTFLPWGWSYLEMCYKQRKGESLDKTRDSQFNDGKIGLRKLAIRAQESLDSWVFDEFGEVEAMVQLAPPDYHRRVIPIRKSLHFRTVAHKGNPEPPGILRGMHRSWYIKSNIENIEAIGVERDLAGLPVGFIPTSILNSTNDNDVRAVAAIKELLIGIKRNEREGAIFPRDYDENGNLEYDLQLLSTGGQRQFDTSKIIERYDQRMLMSVMADFLMLGSKSSGSFALSTDKTEIFSNAMSAWLDMVCEVINRKCIPSLHRLNGLETNRCPRLTHGGIQQITLKEIFEAIAVMSKIPDFKFTPEQDVWIKRRIDMPITDEEHK